MDRPQASGANRLLASGFTSQDVSASLIVRRAPDARLTHALGPPGDVVSAAGVAEDQALRFDVSAPRAGRCRRRPRIPASACGLRGSCPRCRTRRPRSACAVHRQCADRYADRVGRGSRLGR